MKKKMPYKRKLYVLVAVILCLCFGLSIAGTAWSTSVAMQQDMESKVQKAEKSIQKKMRSIRNAKLDAEEAAYLSGLELAEIGDSISGEKFGFYYCCQDDGHVLTKSEPAAYVHGYETFEDKDGDTVYEETLQLHLSLTSYLSQEQMIRMENIFEQTEDAVLLAEGGYEGTELYPSAIRVLIPIEEEQEETGTVWENGKDISILAEQDVSKYLEVFTVETDADLSEKTPMPKGITLESEVFFDGDRDLIQAARASFDQSELQKRNTFFEVKSSGVIATGEKTSVQYCFLGNPLKQALMQFWMVYVILVVFYVVAAGVLYSVMHLFFTKQEQWNWTQQMLARAIAHELKTPLSIIQGYCEGLQYVDDKERQKEYLETITQETKEMDRLVLDMLELSKLETEDYVLEPEEIALSDLLQAVVKQYETVYKEKGITVTIEGEKDIFFQADLSCMYKAISNLLGNAMKHAPEQGEIRIRVEKKKEKILVHIYNNGPEIPEEIRTHIWDGYHKVQKENKSKIRSTGLGLTIVKYMMDLHGFSYGCENKNPGVEFWIAI